MVAHKALSENRPPLCVQPNGDLVQTTELAKQKEGSGAVCLSGRVGVPVAHEWRAGQEWAQRDLLPMFLPTWVQHCAPEVGGHCESED